jgi:hypothetical protein
MGGSIIHSKGCGRKQTSPNYRYYPSICLDGLRETTISFSQDDRCPSRDYGRHTDFIQTNFMHFLVPKTKFPV